MITEEQKRYVIEHINVRPRVKVAKDAGICLHTLYRLIHKYGGKIRFRAKPNPIECKEVVEKLWVTHTVNECAKITGFSRQRILYWVKKLGLEHDEATKERIRRNRLEALALGKDNVSRKVSAQKWKRRRRLDELRILSGLPQLTKLHFKKYPNNSYYQAILRLVKRYGYFKDEEVGGLYTLYYDEETTRTPNEHLFVKRYGLKFEQA